MSIFEDTNPRELKELLGQVHSREAALPDFQRDFVWDPRATSELIVSIAQNYPAGSLLRIRNTQRLFAAREVQNAPPLNGHPPTYLILDGQQRLTSLYQAFFGVGDHRYFLDCQALIDGAEFEECLFYFKTTSRRASRILDNEELQATKLLLPLGVLEGGAGGFGRWSRTVARTRTDNDERVALEDALSDIEEEWIRIIDDYRFPVVTLSDQTEADAVCTIFETLNRTGVKLSVFDLLTARFWPVGVNLRELWAAAKEEHPIIEDFEVEPYYVLQAVALLSRSAPSCKRGDVLKLTASHIERWWTPAVDGLARGLTILRDDCGVILPKWMPYYPMLIPLAAILAKAGDIGGTRAGLVRQRIVRWFWCSVFGQAYERSSNSQSAKDFSEMSSWLDGEEPPEVVSDCRFDPATLRDITHKQRGMYRGAIALILRGAPRDFHTGAPITGDIMIEHHVDDHHVFPQKYLADKGVPARLRDCVLNRTLIDRKTNIRIGKRAPSDYLSEMRAELKNRFEPLLESHQLPGGDLSPLMRDEFEAFLEWRQNQLWKRIKDVTGLVEASGDEDVATAGHG